MKYELNVAHIASTENDSNIPFANFNLENIRGSRLLKVLRQLSHCCDSLQKSGTKFRGKQ